MAATTQPIGGGWDATTGGSSSYPYPQPNGYSCPYCGAWVLYGYGTHICRPWRPYPSTITINSPVLEVNVGDSELKALEEIVEALGKAREAFDALQEVEPGNKRALAYLSARFGVKESVILDLLVTDD